VGVQVQLQSFLTSALDWRSDSLTGRNTPAEKPPASIAYEDEWVHSQSGSSGEETNLSALKETEARFLRRLAGNLVTTLTELPTLPKCCEQPKTYLLSDEATVHTSASEVSCDHDTERLSAAQRRDCGDYLN
jgi:hypothetical protein